MSSCAPSSACAHTAPALAPCPALQRSLSCVLLTAPHPSLAACLRQAGRPARRAAPCPTGRAASGPAVCAGLGAESARPGAAQRAYGAAAGSRAGLPDAGQPDTHAGWRGRVGLTGAWGVEQGVCRGVETRGDCRPWRARGCSPEALRAASQSTSMASRCTRVRMSARAQSGAARGASSSGAGQLLARGCLPEDHAAVVTPKDSCHAPPQNNFPSLLCTRLGA
jgi:hypothetical protein